jgi:spore germination protein YaaH
VKTIFINGNETVYDYTMTLRTKDRINLTWEVYSSVPEYAPKGVNVVSPSSFQISSENLSVEKKSLDGNISFYNSLTRKYMDYADANGYKVWPIYKTDFTLKTADRFLNNPETRLKAIKYILEYACEYGIEGINIDFENIYERNRYLVTKHSRELSVMLHELGLIVSADITRLEPTSANWSMCYNRDALAENCDYIMLMAYDEYYSSSKSAGPVASLDWVEDSIKKTLKEVPSQKLVLGIPFYMRYFEVTGTKVTSSKAISMQTAYELIQKNNPTYTYMESDGQYKISWKNGNKTSSFWLENTDTVSKRVALANKYGLAGVASWRRGLEISKVWDVIEDNLF